MKTETMGRNDLIKRIEELENLRKRWCDKHCVEAINNQLSDEDCQESCYLFSDD